MSTGQRSGYRLGGWTTADPMCKPKAPITDRTNWKKIGYKKISWKETGVWLPLWIKGVQHLNCTDVDVYSLNAVMRLTLHNHDQSCILFGNSIRVHNESLQHCFHPFIPMTFISVLSTVYHTLNKILTLKIWCKTKPYIMEWFSVTSFSSSPISLENKSIVGLFKK